MCRLYYGILGYMAKTQEIACLEIIDGKRTNNLLLHSGDKKKLCTFTWKQSLTMDYWRRQIKW